MAEGWEKKRSHSRDWWRQEWPPSSCQFNHSSPPPPQGSLLHPTASYSHPMAPHHSQCFCTRTLHLSQLRWGHRWGIQTPAAINSSAAEQGASLHGTSLNFCAEIVSLKENIKVPWAIIKAVPIMSNCRSLGADFSQIERNLSQVLFLGPKYRADNCDEVIKNQAHVCA